ncbi:M23 family metallopeptidase [Pseudarthrobacter sp. BRE9]|uniref:M23 family metallopeptidase n=1 Tax=Pseudarthrobacter sp. BRE9 TaxID=2962582 RepID=UPI00288278A0|nr:M23 family metallopeptidase [Pseudarthrobacter sp. BRE9]MDT0169900.1 M23 family metallopeptidase [Pseudarthrobacter sp. BRE9]
MKPPALLAALLLLPASVASPGPSLPYSAAMFNQTAYSPVDGSAATSGQSAPNPWAVPQSERTTTSAAAGAVPSWQWPLAPRPPVLRGFDPPPKPWLSGHRGVDLGFAAAGAPVVSPAAGTVSFVGVVVDRPVITIDHGGGLRSSFEPVESTLAVGATVAAGQVIGTVLPGHCPAAQCLHWGVRDGEVYVNPLQFVLDLRPSILLPLPGPP